MHRSACTALLTLALACSGDPAGPPGPASPPPPSPASATASPPVPPAEARPASAEPPPFEADAAPTADPAELYASCRDRVEGPSTEGECETDDDCVAGGCSGEVCAARDAAAGLMTTCEVRPCYAALDTCGCVEGVCSWALKEGPVSPAPAGAEPIRLPPQ